MGYCACRPLLPAPPLPAAPYSYQRNCRGGGGCQANSVARSFLLSLPPNPLQPTLISHAHGGIPFKTFNASFTANPSPFRTLCFPPLLLGNNGDCYFEEKEGGGGDNNNNNNPNNNNNNGWHGDDGGSGSSGSFFSLFICFVVCCFCTFQLASALATSTSTSSSGYVWEVSGGKWTMLIPHLFDDAFVVVPGTSSGPSSSSFSLSNLWLQCQNLFLRLMLPEGFPESVTSDYLDYSLWRGVQGVASQISGVLATQVRLFTLPHSFRFWKLQYQCFGCWAIIMSE